MKIAERLLKVLQEDQGDRYICNHDGVMEIISGSEAHSLEALKGNMFQAAYEDKHRVFGKLIKAGSFTHEPGLSGKKITDPRISNIDRIEVAIMKENITEEDDDFYATWSLIKGETV